MKSDVNDGKDTRWSSNVKGVVVKTNLRLNLFLAGDTS